MELKCRNLTKYFGENRALDDFTFCFSQGIYGLLGPNGAGKSTLMNLLTCNIKPTSGEIRYGGCPVSMLGSGYRSKIGFMPQQQNIYPDFSVERFLVYMAGLKGLSGSETKVQTGHLLELVNLTGVRKKRLGELSGGMRQRALLAQALFGKPEIIILDEPTAGVDPKERIQIRNIISQVGFGCIILIATHIVPDIQFISKEIILMSSGAIINSGKPSELLEQMKGKVFEIRTDEEKYQEICKKYKTVQMNRNDTDIFLRVVSEERPDGYECRELSPDLEDLYLYLFE